MNRATTAKSCSSSIGFSIYLTAVGDTVHVASRLQDLTNEYHSAGGLGAGGTARRHRPVDVAALRNHRAQPSRTTPLALPVVKSDGQGAPVVWRRLVHSTILRVLQNPIYAGAYAFGRTSTRTHVGGLSISASWPGGSSLWPST
jgi:hypothetical protein